MGTTWPIVEDKKRGAALKCDDASTVAFLAPFPRRNCFLRPTAQDFSEVFSEAESEKVSDVVVVVVLEA